MAYGRGGGGGGGDLCHPHLYIIKGFLQFQNKFLAVGTSLVHVSMRNVSDWTYCLGLKIIQMEVAGKVATPPSLSEN